MNVFTIKDIDELKDILPTKVPINIKIFNMCMDSTVHRFQVLSMFRENNDPKNTITGLELRDLREFVFKVPFDQVPLFINIFPEFVAWRLRIGK